jgi:hypothetical protein
VKAGGVHTGQGCQGSQGSVVFSAKEFERCSLQELEPAPDSIRLATIAWKIARYLKCNIRGVRTEANQAPVAVAYGPQV